MFFSKLSAIHIILLILNIIICIFKLICCFAIFFMFGNSIFNIRLFLFEIEVFFSSINKHRRSGHSKAYSKN